MNRVAELPVLIGKGVYRERHGLMARCAALPGRSFSAIRYWVLGVMGPRPGKTLAEFLIGDFSSMREWGAMTKPRPGRDD
jgi:hypothetical protein